MTFFRLQGLIFVLLLLLQAGCGANRGNSASANGRLTLAEIQKKDAADRAKRERVLSEELITERKKVILAKDGEAIKSYEVFLEQNLRANSRLRAPALKRLADLKMKKAAQQFILEMEAYDLNPAGPPPLIDYGEAINLYNEVLSKYPDFAGNDQVLYALARAHGVSGETAKAIALLESLVATYPEHPHRIEAYFRLGEFYFDREHYKKATVAYEVGASSVDPFFQDKALYKLAWSYFKLENYPEAIRLFIQMVDQTSEALPTFTPKEGSLTWEALSYASSAFRALGGPAVVEAYFKKIGGRRYEREIYLSIGNDYIAKKNITQGIETYETFVRLHPHDPMAPFISSYVMEAYHKYGKPQKADAARIALIKHYDIDSAWHQANDDEAREKARPLIQSALYRVAISFHAKAQKEQQKEEKTAAFTLATSWYRRYLHNFRNAIEALEIQMLLGETLMAVKDYEEAGRVYEKRAFDDSQDQPNRKAAYSAVVAYGRIGTTKGEAAFLSIAKRFALHFPDDPETPLVLFKAGEFLFKREVYLKAAEIFEGLLMDYAEHEIALKTRTLLAHSDMKAGQYHKARFAYRALLDVIPKDQAKKRDVFSDLLGSAIYKEAEGKKATGAIEKAAGLFEEISDEVPKHPLAAEALFEAALLYEKLKIPDDALRVYGKISREYPKSKFVEPSYLHAGLLYEASGAQLEAADAFIAASEITADLRQAEKLIWSAAGLYEKEAEQTKTFKTYLRFVQRFPKHEDAVEALFKMAEIRQKAGRVKAADKLFHSVIKKGQKPPYYGKARLALAERGFASFKSIEIIAPLASSFKKKTQALKKVIDLYTLAIESRQIDVVTHSSYRLGETFEHFQSALLSAEAPKELNEAQLEEYRFQLEEKAYPFEEKAIKAYESNVRRARRRVGLFDQWIKKSYQRLATLRPARYRRKEQTERIVSKLDTETLFTGMQKEATINALANR